MKRYISLLAALGFISLLAACGTAAQAPTEEATNTPEVVASPTPVVSTPTPTSATEEATEAEAFPTPNPNPECVVEPIPEDPNFQPATADDWSEGPDDAQVTLIEYGDFQ